jgi:hypothetical protein
MAKCSIIVSSMKSLYLFEERGKVKVKMESRSYCNDGRGG